MKTSSLARVFIATLVLAVSLGTIAVANARGGAGSASITGTIQTIDPAKKNLTIKTNVGTSVKLSIGKSASIMRNGARSALTGLALNDSVTGQYKVATLSATALTASGPAVTTTSGKASSVSMSAGVLAIGSTKFQTSASTAISRNGKIVALRQITLSDALVAHAATGTTVALDVLADGPDESEVQGVIAAIAGSSVTITPSDGSAAVTITVGSSTEIEVNDAPGTLADLQVAQSVDAEYDPTTLVAFSISTSSETEDAEVEGTVTAIDTVAGTVTIASKDGGAVIILVVNATTEISVNDEGATLADIQVGMPISAEYDAVTLLAKEIDSGGSDD